MAKRRDLAALEADVPWASPAFRAGLLSLSQSCEQASRALAADLRVLFGMLAEVPRCLNDGYGGSPFTSFQQEVAVAMGCTNRAAAAHIRLAEQMCSVLHSAMGLLERGLLGVASAKMMAAELAHVPDELAAEIDLELAEALIDLPPWRVAQQIRKAVLAADGDAAALARARAATERKVILRPLPDGMASVEVFGPALPTMTWFATITERARALKAAGDPRTLQALRYDLTVASFGCATHIPPDPTAEPKTDPATDPTPEPATDPADGVTADPAGGRVVDPASPAAADAPLCGDQSPVELAALVLAADRVRAATGLRASGLPVASADCRAVRPVQAMIVVPVETALGLSNEPSFVTGYGFIDAPLSRQLLVDAELRQVCARPNGQIIDVAARALRPPPEPEPVRQALLGMVHDPIQLSPTATDPVDGHDPGVLMRLLIELRDRYCDGPTSAHISSAATDLDHDTAWPQGPTAAWNLAARARRAHGLKHYGWDPERTSTHTIWRSPAGQVTRQPHWRTPPPGIDPGPELDGLPGLPCDAQLPDAVLLHQLDALLSTPPDVTDLPPGQHPSDTPDTPPDRHHRGPDDLPF